MHENKKKTYNKCRVVSLCPPAKLIYNNRVIYNMSDKNKREIVDTIKRLPAYSKLIYRLYKEPTITKSQKIYLSLAIGYLISPVELVPGVIPVAGQLDDIIIILSILRRVLKGCEEETAKVLLDQYGLSFEILDNDIKASKKLGKKILVGTARFVGHTLVFTGRTVYKAGKRILKNEKLNNG